MSINCLRVEGVHGTGGKNVISCPHVDHVQLTGRSYVGSNEDTVCGGTLRAVTGNGTHFKVLLTDALGNKGGGSAAVAVGCPLTAESQHGLAFLVGAETNGVVGASTIVHNENEGTVLLNADHRTGSIVTTAAYGLADKLSILDNHSEGNADCVEQNALGQVCFNLRLAICLDIARDIAFSIFEYVQDRRGCVQNGSTGSYVLMSVTDPLAVVYQNTGRIGVVIKVSIHTADDVVPKGILVILSHLGELLVRPVGLILQILVDLVIAGDDGHVGVRRVNLNDVKHLSASAGRVVEHDLGLNSSAGDEYVILLGNHVVITICTEAGSVIDNVVLFPIRDGRESGHRERANKHDDRDQQSYYAICRFSHDFFSFS